MAKKPIQFYIDEDLKKRIEKIFERNGLDTASAMRMFVAQVDLTGSIPLNISRAPEAPPESWQFPWTKEELKQMHKDALDQKNISGPFNSTDEMFDHMKKNKECN